MEANDRGGFAGLRRRVEAAVARAGDEARQVKRKVAERMQAHGDVWQAKRKVAERVQAYGDVITLLEMQAVEKNEEPDAKEQARDAESFARCVAALAEGGGEGEPQGCCPTAPSAAHFTACSDRAREALAAFQRLRELLGPEAYVSYVRAHYAKGAILRRRQYRRASAALVLILGAAAALYAARSFTAAQKNAKTAELLTYLDVPADRARAFAAEAEGASPRLRKQMLKDLLREYRPDVSMSEAYDFAERLLKGGWAVGKAAVRKWWARAVAAAKSRAADAARR
jgi:hypothetical protein